MLRNRLFAASLVAAALAFGLCVAASLSSQESAASLAGAQAIIDASKFPTLQAAIDALPPTGGVVRVPPGTFEISGPLRITQDDVLLEGSGTATHLKNVNSSGQPAILIESSKRQADPKAKLWRVQIQNMRITGNDQSGPGILAVDINEIFLHGLTLSNHGGDGVKLDHCYEDPRICDCLLTYNKAAGLNLIGCHDIVVVGNHFEENLDALRCADSFNLCMTGNNLDDHLRDGVVIENTYGSVVSGNMIEECKGTAIVLDRDCYGVTLSANVIAHEVAGGIDLRDAHGCAVSANTFTIVKKDALRIGPKSGRITVTGNNFSSSFIGEGRDKRAESDRDAAGIVLDGCSDVAISGNLFSGLSTKAMTQQQATRVLFSNNVLTETASEHDQLQKSYHSDNLE